MLQCYLHGMKIIIMNIMMIIIIISIIIIIIILKHCSEHLLEFWSRELNSC